jgi:hypothetical protein
MSALIDEALPIADLLFETAHKETESAPVAITALMIARERVLSHARRDLSGEKLEEFEVWARETEQQIRSAGYLAGAAGYDPTKLGRGGES